MYIWEGGRRDEDIEGSGGGRGIKMYICNAKNNKEWI